MRHLILSVLILSAWTVKAETIAQYLFNGTDTVPAASQDPHITASSLTQNGVTFAFPGNSLFFAASDWPENTYGNSFFELTLTPNSGWGINYDVVNVNYTIGTNPQFTFELRSSLDGFTSPIFAHSAGPGSTTYTDSLAPLGLQFGPVTLRWYGQVNANFGTSGFYNSGLLIDSPVTAVVPEPSTTALLTIGLGVSLLPFRKKSIAKS